MERLKKFIASIREAFGYCNHEYVDDREPIESATWSSDPKVKYPISRELIYIQRCKKCNHIRRIVVKL